MTYIFLAHAPEDKPFAAQLSQDLTQAELPNWYSDAADEATYFQNLQKATHIIAILSPSILLAESALGALEHARQNKLERIALRLAPMSALPPQISGILPLDFSNQAAYTDNLETLLADLRVAAPEPVIALPQEILDKVYSADAELRREGIAALGKFRDAGEDLKQLAKDELAAIGFRERDSSLKQLAHLTIKAMDGDTAVDDVELPSKEELKEQAAEFGIDILEEPVAPPIRTIHLWESARWQVVLGIVGIILGGVLLAIGGNPLFAIPALLTGFILPQFNVTIRSAGAFEWSLQGSLIGNTVIALLLTGLSALALNAIEPDLESDGLTVSVLVSVIFGAFIGWLATLKFEVGG